MTADVRSVMSVMTQESVTTVPRSTSFALGVTAEMLGVIFFDHLTFIWDQKLYLVKTKV